VIWSAAAIQMHRETQLWIRRQDSKRSESAVAATHSKQ